MNFPEINKWLPASVKELHKAGKTKADVVLFSGDAYIDHPSFGTAVIGRVMEAEGLTVAVVPQPNWQDDLRDFKKFGKPEMFFAVTAGNMDSMINHYTANKRKRSDDAYTPGGKPGRRPDYAAVTYSKILKQLYPDVPLIIGGIEASLRRLTHYDYWSDRLMPSILTDSGADLLFYGMSEKSIVEFVRLIQKGVPVTNLTNIRQTAFLLKENRSDYPTNKEWGETMLASHEECLKDKKVFAKNFKYIEEESNKVVAKKIIQRVGNDTIVVNPPWPVMQEDETDRIYDLPFTRLPHPRYNGKGSIPAYEMIRHSVNIHRGCFGGCAFCTISAHQGKFIASRSVKSILREIDAIVQMPDFKGYISDLGGPSANMYKMKGIDEQICLKCKRASCIFPEICKNLNTSHSSLLELYRIVGERKDIKKAFVSSGVRYDLILKKSNNPDTDKINMEYLSELIRHHVSGRLKVAPEHTSDKVLAIMRKPSFSLFRKLASEFEKINKSFKLNQQLIPYFISSHPGSTPEDMAHLAIETKRMNFKLEQVQDFTPTPMTMAAVMYYSGYDPYTLEKVYSARTKKERLEQRMFFFWYKKEYRDAIIRYLKSKGKPNLIKQLFK